MFDWFRKKWPNKDLAQVQGAAGGISYTAAAHLLCYIIMRNKCSCYYLRP
jgi:hypothetical protein